VGVFAAWRLAIGYGNGTNIINAVSAMIARSSARLLGGVNYLVSVAFFSFS
jgi:hypothetical protein